MNLVRLYKIRNMGIDIPKEQADIIDYIVDVIKKLKIHVLNSHNNITYYVDNNGNTVLHFNNINRTMYVYKNNLWNNMIFNYKVEYGEYLKIVKHISSIILNLEIYHMVQSDLMYNTELYEYLNPL